MTHAAGTSLEGLFHTHQRLLWGLSYRLTGCAADADDIVQETFARAVAGAPPLGDDAWRPWLVRVATNLGLDVLRRRRRGAYVGAWLPSPIETQEADALPSAEPARSPEGHYELLESVSFAFLLALEALTPRQRAVLLLRDVFDYAAREVAVALQMSEGNVRITHHRARRAMRTYGRERCRPTRELQEKTRRVLEKLVRGLMAQDVAGVEALLVESVRTVADGGGEYTALHGPLAGRSRVALLHLRVARRRAEGARLTFRYINGLPAVLIEYASARNQQAPRAVLRCDLGPDGRIAQLHSVLASRKLSAVHFSSQPDSSDV